MDHKVWNDNVLNEMGKPCPVPVIETKNRLSHMEPGETLEVWVDNAIAVENLLKMAQQLKASHSWEEVAPGEYHVHLIKPMQVDDTEATSSPFLDCAKAETTVAVVIGSEFMGKGEDDLGRILMKGFLYALTEQEPLPNTVLLYNSGARLSSKESESLEDLISLERRGVQILTCGTCIDFLGLEKHPAVGTVTNMYEIVEIMSNADRRIQP